MLSSDTDSKDPNDREGYGDFTTPSQAYPAVWVFRTVAPLAKRAQSETMFYRRSPCRANGVLVLVLEFAALAKRDFVPLDAIS